MKKLIVNFETRPVNPALDPEGGYSMAICDQQILEDDETVYTEVIKEKTLPLSVEMLKFCVDSVIQTTAKKVSEDCRPRRLGNLVKFSAFIRGKVPSPYSSFDPATCSTAVLATPMKGVAKKVNLNKVLFVNAKTGTKVIVDRISYEGSGDAPGLVKVGKAIILTGLNCQFLVGIDYAEIRYTDAEGAKQSFPVTPSASSVTEMRFDWNDDWPITAGQSIELYTSTRAGIEDGEAQPNTKSAEVLPVDPPEAVIEKVVTSGKTGVQKGQPFDAVGSALGFNFATNRVLLKWTVDGVTNQAEIVPVSATAEKISFNSCVLLNDIPDGTELTFTFELEGKSVEKKSTLLAAE